MQFICPRSLPFWQECSGFLGGSADLVGVADMCTAAHSDVANALAAGHVRSGARELLLVGGGHGYLLH